MFTIGQLAKRFKLSRSTLLYYDRIGLLCPFGRTESNYRLYSDADAERLTRIDLFRQAGVSLEDIRTLLETNTPKLRVTLEARLQTINEQIAMLRNQQRLIAKLLRDKNTLLQSGLLNKEDWVSLLRASGMTDDDMIRWHVEFERLNPQAHRDFLCSLGIADQEVDEIRDRARRLSTETRSAQ